MWIWGRAAFRLERQKSMCKKRDKTLDAESRFLFQSRAESTQHANILLAWRLGVNRRSVSVLESVPIQFFVAVGYPASTGSLATELLAEHLPVGATFERFACECSAVIPSHNAVVGLDKDATIGVDHMSGFVSCGDLAIPSVAPVEGKHVRAVDRRAILEHHLATAVFDVLDHCRSAVVAEAVPKLQEVQRVVFPAFWFGVDVVDGDPSVLRTPFAHAGEQAASVGDGCVKEKLHRNARVRCVSVSVVEKRRVQKTPEERDVNVQVVRRHCVASFQCVRVSMRQSLGRYNR